MESEAGKIICEAGYLEVYRTPFYDACHFNNNFHTEMTLDDDALYLLGRLKHSCRENDVELLL